MYIPDYFRNKNLPEIEMFIRQNPYAILINQLEGKPWATHTKNPVSIGTMPKEFVGRLINGVGGFEISIDNIEDKWKLSQNRDDESAANVIRELEALHESNALVMADEMRNVRPEKFRNG